LIANSRNACSGSCITAGYRMSWEEFTG